MLVVGLTGGVATGKSTVARLFQDCGAYVIDADILARQVIEPGKPAWRDMVKIFGTGVLNQDRTVNRAKLAGIVFRDARKLRQLGRIIHPRVARAQARLTREIAKKDRNAVIVYDAPVLIEAGAHTRMDRIIVVTADQATQLARLQTRNGLSRAEALRRIRAQLPLRQKCLLADHVVDGTQPLPDLHRTITGLFDLLSRQV